jgi:putative hemolysin
MNMSNKNLSIFTIMLILVLASSACSLTAAPTRIETNNANIETNNESDTVIGMANPASVYCEEQGGTLEMRQDADGGTYGVCIFADGSECEEWAYFRGECQPQSESNGEQAGPTSEQVVAWYGRVVSSGTVVPAESKLLIAPEGTGEVFVTGESGEIEETILSIRDIEPPGNYANFWGRLDCPNPNECLLTVTQIRVDGPGNFFDAGIVDGWEGTIITTRTEPGSGGSQAFMLSGVFEIGYGIWSENEAIFQLIEGYKDSGQTVRIWGTLTAGIPDWNGTQINVSHIEAVE